MKTIIVEDEFFPRETLIQKLKEHHPEIEVIASFEDAESAFPEILISKPDLLFLDINLPQKNGMWLANEVQQIKSENFEPPGIIFTTAYTDSEYLLNAIKLSAIDYLVKPILIEDLSAAIAKFKSQQHKKDTIMDVVAKEKLLHFKNFGGFLLLRPDDIVFIKADGNYSEIYLSNNANEAIFERLGEIAEHLPETNFLRLGRSVIVNKQFIKGVNTRKNLLQMSTLNNNFEVPISEDCIKQIKEML